MPENRLDLDAYFALPRLLNMHVGPDGSRLALTVQNMAADGKRFASSIWEICTSGDALPRRLTRSDKGETARGFLPDGSLLFTSSRSDLEGPDDTATEGDALYILPAGGGEPRRLLAPLDGVGAVLTARNSSTVVVTAALHPGSTDLAEDEAREKTRREAGVQARLVEQYPDRFWDHDLGPREPHLLALDLVDLDGDIPPPRDLTPHPPWPGWLEDAPLSLREDGAKLAAGARMHTGARLQADLAVIDSATAGELALLIEGDVDHEAVAWSPDGHVIAASWTDMGAPNAPPRFHLSLVDAASRTATVLAAQWDGHVTEILWTRDGRALLVVADEQGHVPVFRIDLGGTVTRLTTSGAYRNLALSPDGAALYAIRSHLNEPPIPVALDVVTADQQPRALPGPVAEVRTGTRLEEMTTAAADGTPIHSWLVLPEGESVGLMPLAVFVHGGPIASHAGWNWRVPATLLAARGWAVLLPNPRLSTGYGHEHIARAWNDWATLPAGDILAAVDAAIARPDIDGERTAALGGSYGGYMANWFAGTTDRFSAIVSHAGLWELRWDRGTSDVGVLLDRAFGDPLHDEESWRRQSPHLRAESLRTPMLVIHGARDQRVPLGHAHSIWLDLQLRGVPSRLLVFPDENHWILKPQNSRLWFETVFAFLGEHVLGDPWVRPELL